LAEERLERGQDDSNKTLKIAESEISKAVDCQVLKTRLSVPETVPPNSEVLHRLADFTHVCLHNKEASGKKLQEEQRTEVLLEGHAQALQQAEWMWRNICSHQAVDCIPLRSCHAHEGRRDNSLMSRISRLQEKFPQVTVEIRPTAPGCSPKPAFQLWFFSADDELLLACRSELISALNILFPGEYKQFQVKDLGKLTHEVMADLQSQNKVSALLDRQRSTVFFCGAVDDVNFAAEYMADFEKANSEETKENDPKKDESLKYTSDAEILEQSCPIDKELLLSGLFTNDEIVLDDEAETRIEILPSCLVPSVRAPALDSYVNVLVPDSLCEPLRQPIKGHTSVSVFDAGDGETDDDTEFVWYYVDDDDIIQGPFDRDEMEEWWTLHLLPEDLLVVCCSSSVMPPDDTSSFRPISELNDILNEVHDCEIDAPREEAIAIGFESLIEELGA
jgi:hypothetical protein